MADSMTDTLTAPVQARRPAAVPPPRRPRHPLPLPGLAPLAVRWGGFCWEGSARFPLWGGRKLKVEVWTCNPWSVSPDAPVSAGQLETLAAALAFPRDLRGRLGRALADFYRSAVAGNTDWAKDGSPSPPLGRDADIWRHVSPAPAVSVGFGAAPGDFRAVTLDFAFASWSSAAGMPGLSAVFRAGWRSPDFDTGTSRDWAVFEMGRGRVPAMPASPFAA